MKSESVGESKDAQTLLLAAALQAAPGEVAVVAASGEIVAVNRAWREFASRNGGDPAVVSEGADYLGVCESADDPFGAAAADAMRAILAGEEVGFSLEYPCHSPDEQRWFLGLFRGFRYEGERYAAVMHVNITQRKLAEDEARESGLRDRLTGLPNRDLLMARLQHEIARSSREADYGFAVLFIDIDDFKSVNDDFGHLVGDEFLVSIAERIRRCVRESDSLSRGGDGHTLGRLGGDEFIVLLQGVTQPKEAAKVVERLQHKLKEAHRIDGREISASVSVGVRLYDGRSTLEEILHDADGAMYQAKRKGKGQYVIDERS